MASPKPRETLAALWDEIDAGQPPTTEVIERVGRQRRRRRVGVAAAAVGVAAVLAAGFVAVDQVGSKDPTATTTAAESSGQRPVVSAEVVRGSTHYDYPGFNDISDAVDGTDIAIAGEVVGWSEGRSFTDGEEIDLTAVLKIRVTDPIDVPASVQGKYLYVEVRRGGYVLDQDGKEFRNPGAPPAYRTVAELAEAVPDGVRVIVLGTSAASDSTFTTRLAGTRVLNSGAGHPADAPLAAPHPQGLLFETHTGGVESGRDHDGPAEWGWLSNAQSSSATFDSLLTQAKQ